MTQPSKQFPTSNSGLTPADQGVPQQSTKHTQLPWETDVEYVVTDGGEWLIATCADAGAKRPDGPEANAAYIVRACNAYPKLVEKLRWLVEVCGDSHPNAARYGMALQEARAVLAEIDREQDAGVPPTP